MREVTVPVRGGSTVDDPLDSALVYRWIPHTRPFALDAEVTGRTHPVPEGPTLLQSSKGSGGRKPVRRSHFTGVL